MRFGSKNKHLNIRIISSRQMYSQKQKKLFERLQIKSAAQSTNLPCKFSAAIRAFKCVLD